MKHPYDIAYDYLAFDYLGNARSVNDDEVCRLATILMDYAEDLKEENESETSTTMINDSEETELVYDEC